MFSILCYSCICVINHYNTYTCCHYTRTNKRNSLLSSLSTHSHSSTHYRKSSIEHVSQTAGEPVFIVVYNWGIITAYSFSKLLRMYIMKCPPEMGCPISYNHCYIWFQLSVMTKSMPLVDMPATTQLWIQWTASKCLHCSKWKHR